VPLRARQKPPDRALCVGGASVLLEEVRCRFRPLRRGTDRRSDRRVHRRPVVAIGFAVVAPIVLAALALRFPRTAASLLVALAGLQTIILAGLRWRREVLALIVLNGAATCIGLFAIREQGRTARIVSPGVNVRTELPVGARQKTPEQAMCMQWTGPTERLRRS
jgi:hypothetical protein